MKRYCVDLNLLVAKLVTIEVEASHPNEAVRKARYALDDNYWLEVRDEGMAQVEVMSVSEKGKDPVG